MRRTLIALAILIALPVAVLAQKAETKQEPKPATKTETVTVKTTIEAIDHAARTVTLKDKDGNYEILHAGPEIKRFDELKVGDQVTFRHTRSVIVMVQKPGESVASTSPSEPTMERGTGPRPSGKITQQTVMTVLIKTIDPKLPSVTVQDEKGRMMSFSVEDTGILKRLKVGDKVEITVNDALVVSVE